MYVMQVGKLDNSGCLEALVRVCPPTDDDSAAAASIATTRPHVSGGVAMRDRIEKWKESIVKNLVTRPSTCQQLFAHSLNSQPRLGEYLNEGDWPLLQTAMPAVEQVPFFYMELAAVDEDDNPTIGLSSPKPYTLAHLGSDHAIRFIVNSRSVELRPSTFYLEPPATVLQSDDVANLAISGLPNQTILIKSKTAAISESMQGGRTKPRGKPGFE